MFRLVRRGSQLILIAVVVLLAYSCSPASSPRPGSSPEAIEDPSFRLEPAYVVSVNVPSDAADKVLRSITRSVPLIYGNYDQVAFRSATGVEQFRPLRGSRAGEQAVPSEVSTTRITFAVPRDLDTLRNVIAAIRHSHPYEEPVVHVESGWMSRAKSGGEESNPNRWWNQPKSLPETQSGSQHK
jgi:hypothetical protein